jgi:phenylalanyl-tRNA synthetase beta chain
VQLVDVDTGDGEALQIVCGAFNMEVGDLVPLATVGTTMPNGLEIGRRKVRGEYSNGMLCSAPELGIGPEGPEPAIYVLPPGTAAPGEPIAKALGFGADVVFDLEISPNRGDCFSVAGVARDLAAGLGLPFSVPEPQGSVDAGAEPAIVAIEASAEALCPRFTGTVVQGVQAAQVSALVRRRLVLAGMRPINPVVDASNYVMLEIGQPNHPYDISRLGGQALVVRRGKSGEKMVTLDGVERHLGPEDIVIADGEGLAVGVAGIMGGAGSQISAETSTVLLEVANFDPQTVSATGKRLGLLSEARTRFERGVDPEVAGWAVSRFVELLGPLVSRGPTTDLRPRPSAPTVVSFRPARVNAVLGTSLAEEEPTGYLARLGFQTRRLGDDDWAVRVPSWRFDCSREVDLVEEVARIYGYDRIPRALPPRPARPSRLADWQQFRRRVREVLAGAGASEAWTSSFVSVRDMELAGLDAEGAVGVANPLDSSEARLRTSLLPGLLRAARANLERQTASVSLFELGNVFVVAREPAAAPGEGAWTGGFSYAVVEGVREREQLGLVAAGAGVDATYAARTFEVLAGGLRLEAGALVPFPEGAVSLEPWASQQHSERDLCRLAVPALHAGRRAVIEVAGRSAGVLGELAPEVASRSGLPGRVAVLLADLSALASGSRPPLSAREVSRYPAVDLDMAFLVGEEVPAGALWATVSEVAGELAEEVVLFDVWRDRSLGEGRRSLAFRARLRARDRTLTEADVAKVRSKVAAAAAERHGAELRGADA